MRVITVEYISPAQELLNEWGAEVVADNHNNVNRLTDVKGVKTRESREWIITDQITLGGDHAPLYLLTNRKSGVPMIAALEDMGNTY